MSEALERAYASAPLASYPIDTLEISSDAFAAPFRLAQAFEDIEATLETSETVTFTAAAIGISLPQRGIQGREDLLFQLDNVSGEAISTLRLALDSGEQITVIYRVFLSDDLLAPAERPLTLIATSAKANTKTMTIAASFRDFVNKEWPRRRYTKDFAPGLTYFLA